MKVTPPSPARSVRRIRLGYTPVMSRNQEAPWGGFPVTRWSAVIGVRSDDAVERERSIEKIAAAYWKPVYKYLRLRWNRSVEDSQDLTQEFFTRALEKGFFEGYDPDKGHFRTFLRVCLDRFVSNQDKAARRLKRGGGVRHLPLEFERAEGEITQAPIPAPQDIEKTFDAEWVRGLFELAVTDLREDCAARGNPTRFELFAAYDLDEGDPGKTSYEELAGRFGLTISQVTNSLFAARRSFRKHLLDRLRELTVSDEEFRMEARFLLGRDPGR